MQETITVQSTALAKMVDQLSAMLRQDARLRTEQAKNAPYATAFDDQTGVGVSGNTVYLFQEAQTGDRIFHSAALSFNAVSGSGRYRIDGPVPLPAVGMPIPAGGVVLNIVGHMNVRNFRMIAEAGQVLTFSRYLFL